MRISCRVYLGNRPMHRAEHEAGNSGGQRNLPRNGVSLLSHQSGFRVKYADVPVPLLHTKEDTIS
jgi:hypothetical protein